MTTSNRLNEQLIPTPRRIAPLDLVALATSMCLVLTVVLIQCKLMPTYAALMAQGGYSIPIALRISLKAFPWMPVYVLLLLLGWALYRRLRHRSQPRVTLAPVLAAVNILAVLVLMAQTSGFVSFAIHAPAMVQHASAAQQQSPAKKAAPPIPRQ
jgi:hypothetical protein